MGKFRRIAQFGRQQPSLFFDPWADGGAVSDKEGRPKMLYHGTTHSFDRFNPNNQFGNPTGYFGDSFYFTDSPVDVDNYAGEGPDLTGRIEEKADQIIQNLYDDPYSYYEEYGKLYPAAFSVENEGTDEERVSSGDPDEMMNLARKIAQGELSGGSPNVMPVYLRMRNPLNIVPGEETRFDYSNGETYDEEQDEYYPGEESGLVMELYNSILSVAPEYDLDGQQVWNELLEKIGDEIADGDVSAAKVNAALRDISDVAYLQDYETGEIVGPRFIRDVFQHMGYDGVIMDAYKHFGPRNSGFGNARIPGMNNLPPGTKHYITWEPTNIKSAIGNNGMYDPENPQITARVIQSLVRTAKTCDKQGLYRQADLLTDEMLRYAASVEMKGKAEAVSKAFLGTHTIHSVSPSTKGITVYCDDLNAIPSSVKDKIRSIAAPFPVKFKFSDVSDEANESNRLDRFN